MLSNYGFHEISVKDDINQLSIDKKDDFVARLTSSLNDSIMDKHIKSMHDDNKFFETVSRKINQFDDGFSTFDLIPAEFGST